MSAIHRRFRSLLIALVVLALSAGVALAGRGAHPASVPTSHPVDQVDREGADEDGDADEAPEVDEDGDADEDADAPDEDAESPDEDTDAPDEDAGGGEHPDNHGLDVSTAAHADTPAEFDNHGAYVKSVAQNNHGHEAAAAAKAKHAKPKGR